MLLDSKGSQGQLIGRTPYMQNVHVKAEDGYDPAIVLIHPDNQWDEDSTNKKFQRGYLKGLAPAGRLDSYNFV